MKDKRAMMQRAVEDKKIFLRTLNIGDGARQVEANDERTVPVSFSSEEPYRQWWGLEVLSHEDGAMRLDELSAGISPVLFNHDRDSQIGVVESAEVVDKRGEAVLRFSKSVAGDEIYQDVLDGIRKQVSVGYSISKYEVENAEEEDEFVRVTDWTPHEISIVTLAADKTIGVGRSELFTSENALESGKGADTMDDTKRQEQIKQLGIEYQCPDDAQRAIDDGTGYEDFLKDLLRAKAAIAKDKEDKVDPPAEPTKDAEPEPEAARGDTDDDEPEKVVDITGAQVDTINKLSEEEVAKAIFDLGQKHGLSDLAQKAIIDKTTLEDFKDKVLEHTLQEQGREMLGFSKTRIDAPVYEPQDVKRFKVTNLIKRMINPDASGVEGGLELEMVSEEAKFRKRMGHDVQGKAIPHSLLGVTSGQRDLTAGVNTAGGYTVDDDLMASMFVEYLLENTAASRLCTKLTDLTSDITIPRHTTRGTAQWTAETTAPTETNQVFDVIQMSPKHVRAFTSVSTTLLRQSSIDIERFVRMDLANAIATSMDNAVIAGTGSSNQPTGIKSQTGINTVTYTGTPAFNDYLQVEQQLADDNALMGNLAWVVAPNIRTSARQTAELGTGTETPIWNGNMILEYPANISTNVPNNEALFANWSECLLAMWGGVDIIVDPYTLSTRGLIRISVFQMMDFALRHPVSVCTLTQ